MADVRRRLIKLCIFPAEKKIISVRTYAMKSATIIKHNLTVELLQERKRTSVVKDEDGGIKRKRSQ